MILLRTNYPTNSLEVKAPLSEGLCREASVTNAFAIRKFYSSSPLVLELSKFSMAMCFSEKRLIFSDLNLVSYSR